MFTLASEAAKMWLTCRAHCMKIRQIPSHHKYAVHCMRKTPPPQQQQLSPHHLFVFDPLPEETICGLAFETKLHSTINICVTTCKAEQVKECAMGIITMNRPLHFQTQAVHESFICLNNGTQTLAGVLAAYFC